MITIQGFAKLCGCNTQTLRYYDRIGLLTPAKVDEWTGYRYYEEEQALLYVKIKNLQQADFSIEEIKTLLPGDDDLLTAAFERKIREQQQKLERIREIQRSYLKEKMYIQRLVDAIIGFVEGQLDNPALWEEFGISTDRKAEMTAKAHAMLADMMAKNKETLETVTMTMDDQAVTGAENVIRAIQNGHIPDPFRDMGPSVTLENDSGVFRNPVGFFCPVRVDKDSVSGIQAAVLNSPDHVLNPGNRMIIHGHGNGLQRFFVFGHHVSQHRVGLCCHLCLSIRTDAKFFPKGRIVQLPFHKPDDCVDQFLHIHLFFEIRSLYFPDPFQFLLLFPDFPLECRCEDLVIFRKKRFDLLNGEIRLLQILDLHKQ